MRIALVAHDNKKQEMINFSVAYEPILKKHELFATGTTGQKIMDASGLNIHRFQSGPLGGDQQIGALIAQNEMDLVLFFRDPLTAQAHEPDISALIRLCDVYQIPVATNVASGELFIRAMERGDFNWRTIIREREGQSS
ncbi:MULTISPECIES: methylglyoxal synthase [Fictibacillus]|uniref:Methylglyoxal synthase n=1 Tax=Fictibacillus enclensis TaxID=1017270 RepID=A0A0V8JF26_9BACL|nr:MULTISPECIES: methylglyoxal synthase [Fictibacillus]KSU85562.1 methylglyoxal synthase [Fictibacillus enclensis]RXY98747.1 methylglyoxal synthase [Fictibacillus sp. S7]SCB98894.1 methylglyoxal synthase [Fictibacillus enclensis]